MIQNEIETAFTEARPRLLRLAALRGVAPAFLEDVAQESLLEAWRSLPRLQAPEMFDAWLDGICRNVCQRWLQRHTRLAARHVSLSTPVATNLDKTPPDLDLPDPAQPDPLAELDRRELELLIDRALGYLSAENRQAIELTYLHELPQKETALHLDLTTSALEARLHRARRQLQQVIAGELRVEALSLGLELDEAGTLGWRDSHEWCSQCGRRRLRGVFQPQPDGSVQLLMQCPDCHPHTQATSLQAILPARAWRSFRPAIKHAQCAVLELVEQYQQHIARCPRCGAHAPIQLMRLGDYWRRFSPEFKPAAHIPDLAQKAEVLHIVQHCAACSFHFIGIAGMHAMTHSTAQRFDKEHPRAIFTMPLHVEYNGLPAIRHQFTDLASAARLTIFVHRQSLQVLAVLDE